MVVLPKGTASRLSKARQLGGLSCRQLAALAGLAEGFVAQIERGAAKAPSFGVVASLAHVLGVSLDWLAHGVGSAPTKAQVIEAVERVRAESTPPAAVA